MDTLHHIALPVTDIDKAVAWYEKNFNIRKIYADESWALLSFENISVALVLPDQHPRHVAVERADAEEFGALTTHRDGSVSAYAQDPWGNSIEYVKPVRP